MATYRLGSSPAVHTPGIVAWAINGYHLALSQILQVNSMLTMGREVAAPDIAERADDFEYHCRKAEAPVEG